MAAVQLTLLGRREPTVDPRLRGLRRIELSDGAWVDRCPGWVEGHSTLFDELYGATGWEQTEQNLYDGVVATPRLVAFSSGVPEHSLFASISAALEARYGHAFDRVGLALYRDGRDSVAWHRDREYRERNADGCVAIVSLGGPRRFLLRPRGGGRSHRFSVGWGDLMVMGAAANRDWEHCVPKSKTAAAPRIALMFRHGW